MEEKKSRYTQARKEHYKAAAVAAGTSLNQFFIDAADEKIDREAGAH